MSTSEAAVHKLRQTLAELIPTLLDSLANLHRQHSEHLSPDVTFATLRPLVVDPDFNVAFVGRDTSSSNATPSELDTRLRNLCLEVSRNELRRLVFEPASDSSDIGSEGETLSGKALKDIFDRLDVTLALAMEDLIDESLPLTLVEELIDVNTVPTCFHLFSYIESRVKQLTIGLYSHKGKGLVLLRTCNELLRRLSKPSQTHTVFAGRILSLLAGVFGISERAGVNMRGDFNIENNTAIDAADGYDEQGDTSADRIADDNDKDAVFRVDHSFYELFWKVQRFFSNPRLLMTAVTDASKPPTRAPSPGSGERDEVEVQASEEDPAPEGAKGPMAEFRISTHKIMKFFSAVAKREKELAGATAAEAAKEGSSQKATLGQVQASSTGVSGYFAGQGTQTSADNDANHSKRYMPDVVDGIVTKDSIAADVDQVNQDNRESPEVKGRPFFPKYLTGRKLFEYEVRDISFRKHILVQFLVLFQYLLSLAPANRKRQINWKNPHVKSTFRLDDADERWIRSTFGDILALIRNIQPDGPLFADAVREVLKRETNWIRWKEDMCPPVEKPPLSPEQITEFASARARLMKEPAEFPHKLGTAALSELWQDGLPPPVAGTRTGEDDSGNEITMPTDGLEELEIPPPIPSLEHYNKLIKREDMKVNLRKKQLGINIDVDQTKLTADEQLKLDQDENIQATTEGAQSLAWRALRIASRESLHLFDHLKQPDNIDELLAAMKNDRKPKSKRKSLASPERKSKEAKSGQEENSNGKLQHDDTAGDKSQEGDLTNADTQDGTEVHEGVQEDQDALALEVKDGPATPLDKASGTFDDGQDVDMIDATS